MPYGPRWLDEPYGVTLVVSAEQHALDNVGHMVTVRVTEITVKYYTLSLTCKHAGCGWWDDQGVRVEQ